MTRPAYLVVVRHAPPVKSGICYGQSDVVVSPNAEGAAERVLRQLPDGIERLYCSPSARTRTLATTISMRTGKDVTVDARLAEVNFGEWEGREWNEIYRTCPDELTFWAEMPLLRAPPKGETGQDLVRRLLEFVAERDADAERALLVCHAGPIRALRALSQLVPEQRHPQNVTSFDFARPVQPLDVETIPWG